MKSVLQDWVMRLGLRHQGVLVSATRGCDAVPKDDPSKRLARAYRAVILNSHCGDPAKAKSYIEAVGLHELMDRFMAFRKNMDHYPHHYVMHMVHAIEIVGYHHPEERTREHWRMMYVALCTALHLNVETRQQLDERLNADEATFAARDFTCDGTPTPGVEHAVPAGRDRC